MATPIVANLPHTENRRIEALIAAMEKADSQEERNKLLELFLIEAEKEEKESLFHLVRQHNHARVLQWVAEQAKITIPSVVASAIQQATSAISSAFTRMFQKFSNIKFNFAIEKAADGTQHIKVSSDKLEDRNVISEGASALSETFSALKEAGKGEDFVVDTATVHGVTTTRIDVASTHPAYVPTYTPTAHTHPVPAPSSYWRLELTPGTRIDVSTRISFRDVLSATRHLSTPADEHAANSGVFRPHPRMERILEGLLLFYHIVKAAPVSYQFVQDYAHDLGVRADDLERMQEILRPFNNQI